MLEYRNDVDDDVPESWLSEVIDLVFTGEGIASERVVSILLTNDETTRTANHHYRGVNQTTDVISFPSDTPDLDLLGDVLINLDEVRRSGRPEKDEIQLLLLHGLLHLLGYDHLATGDAKIMTSKQTAYWEALKSGE